MSEKETETMGKFIYERDSKRYHRFSIKSEDGVMGSLYVPKGMEPLPKRLILEYTEGTNDK